jgi:hypothetical protein
MTAVVNFTIKLNITNPELFPELAARANDLRPAFEDIIDKWARNNEEKFAASVGMELSGAQVDPSVFWEPLTESTSTSKRRRGVPDQIMVDTGELKMALEDEEGFFRATSPQEAVWGTPKSFDDELKVKFNYEKRPAIFLGLVDQKNIESDVSNYLSLGENWKDIIFARGMQNLARREESASMNMAFEESMAGK